MTERKIVHGFAVNRGLKSGYAIRAVGVKIKDDGTETPYSELWIVASDPEELGSVMTEIATDHLEGDDPAANQP